MRCLTLLVIGALACKANRVDPDFVEKDTGTTGAEPAEETEDAPPPERDSGEPEEEEPPPVDTEETDTADETETESSDEPDEDPLVEDVDGDGFTLIEGDCDDLDDRIHPAAIEMCDDLDNNCDGRIDEDSAIDARPFYADADGDGFGAATTTIMACAAPAGFVTNSSDCDDLADMAHPGGIEICDGLDNDCDGLVDPTTAGDSVTWYRDRDMDGYGDATETVSSCSPPADDYALESGDCDDVESRANPGASEICDEIDNDCDGDVDEGAAAPSVFYRDADSDGFGSDEDTVVVCEDPGTEWIEVGGDCNDASPVAFPGGAEVCDELDNDCDGGVDEGSAAPLTWFHDGDADGYGDALSPKTACESPDSYVADSSDCDDTTAIIRPGGSEVCDEVDNDCDGEIDEGSAAPTVWFKDADLDGYGDPDNTTEACEAPGARWLTFAGDCDDTDATSHPDGIEVCDGADNDCDGVADPASAEDASLWYRDADEDGFGVSEESLVACEAPGSDYSLTVGDCDDDQPEAFPGAEEYCDEIDNDCDGHVDEGDAAERTWYRDSDGDGYGVDSSTRTSCSAPSSSYVMQGGDCNDSNENINPGAEEICSNFDRNCDGDVGTGIVTWWGDDGSVESMTDEMTSMTGTVRLGRSGALWVCEGTWTTRIVTTGDDVSIVGYGDAGAIVLDASDSGPVIWAQDSTDSLTVENLTITGGEAEYGGGIRATSADVVVETSLVTENLAEESGGGIYVASGSLEVVDSVVSHNELSGTASHGGGIRVEDGSVILVDSEINHNGGTGRVWGGGLSVGEGDATLDGSSVEYNEASESGGGISLGDGIIRMTDSKVRYNEASEYGGGVKVSGDLLMENSSVRGNVAGTNGGGAYLAVRTDGTYPLLSCDTDDDVVAGFRSNEAIDGLGGGVYSAAVFLEIDSYTCDWGQGDANNEPHDIRTRYFMANAGSNASFECNGYYCLGDIRVTSD